MVNGNQKEPALQNAAARTEPPTPGPSLERTYRDHAQRVLAAAYRVTGNRDDAQDVLQTVFLRLVRRERGALLSDNPGPYLHRAAINAGLDLLRSRRSARATPLEGVEATLADTAQRGPDQLQGSRELRSEIRKALSRQSPKAAEIFALRYFEGYDNKEISRMVGSSPSTVAVILHRTRNRLRDEIGTLLGESS
jgi:RNA polymerase sigma-70 factor (ECF subfamily)